MADPPEINSAVYKKSVSVDQSVGAGQFSLEIQNSTFSLFFQTVTLILNTEKLLEPGLKKSLPKILPVPWFWVRTRN